MQKMLFFVNPAAGREEMHYQLMDVLSRFTAAGYDVVCHPTQKLRTLPRLSSSRETNTT